MYRVCEETKPQKNIYFLIFLDKIYIHFAKVFNVIFINFYEK